MTAARHRAAAAVLALVLAVAASACGGGDGDDTAPGPDAVTTPTAAAGGSTATTVAATGTTAAATTTTTTTTITARPVGATTRPTAATTTAPPAPGLPFTAPGTYRYASTGQLTSSVGGPQSRDGETTLTVDPPSGADQRSVRRAFTRTTEQVLRLDAGGAHLAYFRLTDQGLDKAVRASPPVLALPADAAPGRTWTWRLTSTDGQTSVDSTFRAVRAETVAVGGEAVPVLVVEVVLSLSGDLVATLTQTVWISLERRLVVRQDESSSGRYGVVTFSGRTSETLTSLTSG